jgi:hypothetical protein
LQRTIDEIVSLIRISEVTTLAAFILGLTTHDLRFMLSAMSHQL